MGVRLHGQWRSETGAHAPVLLKCVPATSTSILIIKLNVFTINVNYVIIVKWWLGTSLP